MSVTYIKCARQEHAIYDCQPLSWRKRIKKGYSHVGQALDSSSGTTSTKCTKDGKLLKARLQKQNETIWHTPNIDKKKRNDQSRTHLGLQTLFLSGQLPLLRRNACLPKSACLDQLLQARAVTSLPAEDVRQPVPFLFEGLQ